ncbi:MAG TPA: PH domain-containing protein [Symbiobacteriaceae bacterium]|nr:PH domain-containing protein [Symbiobacteriaceae bacterium]
MSFLTKLINTDGRKVSYAVAFIVLAIMGAAWFSFNATMSFTASDSSLTISYRGVLFMKTTYEVDYADIERVEILPKAPPMRRSFGFGVGQIQVGTYANNDLGSFKAVINDLTHPLLFIKAKDQAYLISPDDAEGLKQTIEQKKAQ